MVRKKVKREEGCDERKKPPFFEKSLKIIKKL
jgi:hypothetical protein